MTFKGILIFKCVYICLFALICLLQFNSKVEVGGGTFVNLLLRHVWPHQDLIMWATVTAVCLTHNLVTCLVSGTTGISNVFVGELGVDVVVSGPGYDDEFVVYEGHVLDGETGGTVGVRPGDPIIYIGK